MDNIKPENTDELKGESLLQEYERKVVETDRFSNKEIIPILLGLYGEVGSIMAASKKYRREKKAYPGYKEAVEEEFGDALWYFSALNRRLGVKLEDIFINMVDGIDISNDNSENKLFSGKITKSQIESLDSSLIELGQKAAQLLKISEEPLGISEHLFQFASLYLQSLNLTGLSFKNIIKRNLEKVIGRFSIPKIELLPDFDAKFPEEEQLPRNFEIRIVQREKGKSYMRWNGVFIGDPLTDNNKDPDGYRFHDVFHLAFAAILHWSPTFRGLIKQKRKSDPTIDEVQDGGRAIVVEEGLAAWLFSYSKGLEFFRGHDSVSFDVLKIIQKFVQGYEVEQCPLKLWEDAILQGYSVFRQVRKNNGGLVVGDRKNRKISYRPIGE